MTEINFTSTFRIPITQPGINNSKKLQLRALIGAHNGLIGSGKQGYARISMPDSEDEEFLRKLKKIGYSRYQRFDGESIPNKKLDTFIKQKLDTRDYNQKGTNMKPMTQEMKEQRRYDRRYTPPVKPEETVEPEIIETVAKPKEKIEPAKNTTSKKLELEYLQDESKKAKIRQTEGYQKLKAEYGEEFAEAVYFSTRKRV